MTCSSTGARAASKCWTMWRRSTRRNTFAGMVTLAKVIRWEIGDPGAFDRPRSPEEVVERLEQRIGPEGRKLFERFLREVQQLEERQQLTASPSDPTAPERLHRGFATPSRPKPTGLG